MAPGASSGRQLLLALFITAFNALFLGEAGANGAPFFVLFLFILRVSLGTRAQNA